MNQGYYNQPGDPGTAFFPYYGPSYPPWLYYFPPFPEYADPSPPLGFSSSANSGGGVNKTAIITPAVVAGIALLGSAVLLVSYYKVFARYCSAWHMFFWRDSRVEEYRNEDSFEQGWLVAHGMNSGLDESVVKQIPVLVFRSGAEAILGSNECAVCLGEFEEHEHLRVLPKCTHAFHLSCIDVWLRSHSNCPLCRAPVVSPKAPVNTPQAVDNNIVTQTSEAEQQGETRSASVRLDEEENERRNRLRAVLRRSYSTGTNPPSYHECFLKGTEFVLTDIRVDSSSSPSTSSSGNNPDTRPKPGFFKATLKRSLSTGARIFSLRSSVTQTRLQAFDTELHSAPPT